MRNSEVAETDNDQRHQARSQLAWVTVRQAGEQHQQRAEQRNLLKLQRQQHCRHCGHQRTGAAGTFPAEHQDHVRRQAGAEKDVHARFLRVGNHAR